MKLAPHMIQSMEILQLPILALQERIEQELNSNPVLEVEEISNPQEQSEQSASTAADQAESYERFESLSDEYQDYISQAEPYTRRPRAPEEDKKLEAIKNTAAKPQSLHDHLEQQWRFIEATEPVKKAGTIIIDYINSRGYLSVRLEQLHNKDRTDFTYDDLKNALELVQRLEPTGVGARDLKECLLIQMAQANEDYSFEAKLVAEHIQELLENRLPDIARSLKCDLDKINTAIERLARFDTSPGLQISPDQNIPITADVIVEQADDEEGFNVRLADNNLPSLRLNDYYLNIAKNSATSEETKKFLQENIRSAHWIIDAIQQRKNTLLRVAKSVVKYQTDFFEKGQLYLKPLPMAKVADDVGIHIATVSRAVAGKYVQCSWGILPLRKFFSGGTEDQNGQSYSWEAIRGKLQQIIDSEDKSKPLSDDQIKKKLAQAGINNIARRTVAKYRKLLDIPSARLRKKF